jgi:AP endonuclease-1
MTEASVSSSRKRTTRSEISPPPKRQRKAVGTAHKSTSQETKTAITRKRVNSKASHTEVVVDEIVKIEEATKNSLVQATESISKVKTKKKTKEEARNPIVEETVSVTKAKIKRKTKEEKEAEEMPIAARTVGSKILVGAHVSAAGGK